MSRYPYYPQQNDRRERDGSGGRIYDGFQAKPSGLIETVRPMCLFNQRIEPLAYNLVRELTPDTVYQNTNGPLEQDEATGETTEIWIQFPPIIGSTIFFGSVDLGAFFCAYGNTLSGMIVEADSINAAWDPTTLTWNNSRVVANSFFGQDFLNEFSGAAGQINGTVSLDDGFASGWAVAGAVWSSLFHGIRLRCSNATLDTNEVRSVLTASNAFVLVNAQ